MITTIESYANPTVHRVVPAITLAGRDIRLAANTFVLSGASHQLDELVTTIPVDLLHAQGVIGYLAKSQADGTVTLLVDVIPHDGLHRAYGGGGGYDVIWRLFMLKVPAGSTPIDDVDITIMSTTDLLPEDSNG